MGTYRAALKANDRLGVRMASRLGGAGGYLHWQKYKKLGQPMPCAIVIGCAPAVLFTGPQKLTIDQDEMEVAGGLMGRAVRTVRCKTVDLVVPADAEIVIEGLIDTDLLEPEGPFGESHGHVALEDFNMSMRVTAITRKRKPVFLSIISQVTPSKSSVLKKVAYEPLFLEHLRHVLAVSGIKRVVMHEPLTNLRKVIFLNSSAARQKRKCGAACRGAATLAGAMRQASSSRCPRTFRRTMPTPSSGRWPIAPISWRTSISRRIDRADTGPNPGARKMGGNADDRRNAQARHAALGVADRGIHDARAKNLG